MSNALPKAAHSEPLAVSALEAARLLGISKRTVFELIMRQELGSVKIGRCRRVPMAAIHRLIERSPRYAAASTLAGGVG